MKDMQTVFFVIVFCVVATISLDHCNEGWKNAGKIRYVWKTSKESVEKCGICHVLFSNFDIFIIRRFCSKPTIINLKPLYQMRNINLQFSGQFWSQNQREWKEWKREKRRREWMTHSYVNLIGLDDGHRYERHSATHVLLYTHIYIYELITVEISEKLVFIFLYKLSERSNKNVKDWYWSLFPTTWIYFIKYGSSLCTLAQSLSVFTLHCFCSIQFREKSN